MSETLEECALVTSTDGSYAILPVSTYARVDVTVLIDGEEQQVVADRQQYCANCGRTEAEHSAGQCLFDSTPFVLAPERTRYVINCPVRTQIVGVTKP